MRNRLEFNGERRLWIACPDRPIDGPGLYRYTIKLPLIRRADKWLGLPFVAYAVWKAL